MRAGSLAHCRKDKGGMGMLRTVGTWGVGCRIPRAVRPANGRGCDGVNKMLLTTLHRIGADPGAKCLGTIRRLRAMQMSGRITSAADPLVRRSVVEIAIEKPRSLAVVEWLHIFFPVFPQVQRPLRSDDVGSSCTCPNRDERSRGVIAALLSWSTIRGRDRSHAKTRARMISLR